jgi:glycosyltransferase involved in cell wall biosynthesis
VAQVSLATVCSANSTRTPIRVTFVVESSAYGGAEAYLVHLLRYLPEPFVCTIVATRPLPKQIEAAAEELHVPFVMVAPVRGKFDVVALARQRRAIGKTRPHLVHVNMTTIANGRHLIGALVMTQQAPVIATLHSVAPLGSRVQTRILRAAYRRLSRVITVSEGTRQQLRDELRVDDDVVRLIRNGVELQHNRTRPTHVPVRIGSLGRLTREKGFDLLIEAIRPLRVGEDITVVLGGEGPERGALELQARGLPIELAGYVEDVPAFLGDLDIFCLASRWEGLPFSLLEAMMGGLPCVATDVGDIAPALGDAGILVPPEDVAALTAALRRLVESRMERLRLGRAAHARAKTHLSVEAMVRSTVDVYAEVLAA